jgi:hypothetical protein
MTEKAFPEDEWVITGAANTDGDGLATKLIYEKRFGARNQLEIVAPLNFVQRGAEGWEGGIGDLVFGYKRVMMSNARTGSIMSLQGEVIAPTGDRTRGLGSGFTTFETFATFGQLLPRLSFLQLQAGVELPTDGDRGSKAVFWRGAIGTAFAQGGGFGRTWAPIIEVLADRELETGAVTNWDILP